jgi:hypothetical protein
LKKPITKNRVCGVAQGVGPEFKSQCRKKKGMKSYHIIQHGLTSRLLC